MAVPVAAIIQAVGAIGSAIASGVAAKKQQERANQFSLAQQKMQNEYNSASAQMARFNQAGLNPNLIYGQVNNTPSVGADYQLAKYDNMFNAIQQIVPVMQDIFKTSAQIKLIENDAEIKKEQLLSLQRGNRLGDLHEEKKWLKMEQEINNLKKSGKLSDKQLEYYDDLTKSQINLFKSQKTNADANSARLMQDYEYYNNPTQQYSRNMGPWETLIFNLFGKYQEELKEFFKEHKITMPNIN